ncbi:MAG TPA: efflux RND transporter periplasmic adaptor subunit [Candidatus Paceibacterota bacterium]|nr:efflux RND transporter periplasmic adaptor subunit [Candidatus Paceibacterota bacterium]
MEPLSSQSVRAQRLAGRVKAWAFAHKFWSLIILAALLYGGYTAYASATAPSTAPRYVTATVATGTVVATINETGQVSPAQELTLSPKASGEVLAVYVTPGEHVYAGQVIAQLDASDAQRSLANAQLSLENEQLQYQQTTATSTLSLNLLEAQNGVTSAQIALQKAHDGAYSSIAGVYTDLAATVSDLDGALHDSDVVSRGSEQNLDAYADLVSLDDNQIGIFKNSAETSYQAAYAAYNAAVAAYKAAGLSATDDQLSTLASDTYTATQAVAEAVKDSHDFFDRVTTDENVNNFKNDSVLAGLLSRSNADGTTVGNDLSAALSARSDLVSAGQALAQAQDALAKAEGGANTLTVQQATLSLEQAQQALASAKENVADYTVVAPFSGTVASVGVKKYDQASSGTAVATLVTDDQGVDISVNEVDAAKLKIGQKATVTFDALPGVSIAGTVSQLDSLGTVSSGVVSYDAVITFDTQNAAIKPGMSASAAIVTGTASGLVVPASAIHTAGGASYALVFDPPLADPAEATAQTPEQVPVTTGLSSATETVVTSGLTPGEQVVVSTSGSASATKTSAASATSVFGGGGVRAVGPVGGGNATFRSGGGG